MRIAIIDSSCLISLSHLGLAPKLSLFFQLVFVPVSVQREVNKKHRFRYRLNKLYESGLFQKCVVADRVRVEWLLDELHEGEAEALVQAQERQAAFFIGDERRAREISQLMGIKPLGTARLLARLNMDGLADDPRSLVRRLRRDLGYRITDSIVEQAIEEASEPI